MIEQYLCKSYYDDNNILQDCICGKCGEVRGYKQRLKEEFEKEFEFEYADQKIIVFRYDYIAKGTLWNWISNKLDELEAKTRRESVLTFVEWYLDHAGGRKHEVCVQEATFRLIAKDHLDKYLSTQSNESSENVKGEDIEKDHLKIEENVVAASSLGKSPTEVGLKKYMDRMVELSKADETIELAKIGKLVVELFEKLDSLSTNVQ